MSASVRRSDLLRAPSVTLNKKLREQLLRRCDFGLSPNRHCRQGCVEIPDRSKDQALSQNVLRACRVNGNAHFTCDQAEDSFRIERILSDFRDKPGATANSEEVIVVVLPTAWVAEHDRFSREVAQVDGLLIGQWMIFVEHGHVRIVLNSRAREFRVVDGASKESEIEISVLELFQLSRREPMLGLYRDVGIPFVKIPQDLGKLSANGKIRVTDNQMAEFAGRCLVCSGDYALHRIEHILAAGEKNRTGVCEPYTPIGTFEELNAELGLKVLDGTAQRWLRQVQPLGGTPEMQLFGDSRKVPDMFQSEIHDIKTASVNPNLILYMHCITCDIFFLHTTGRK